MTRQRQAAKWLRKDGLGSMDGPKYINDSREAAKPRSTWEVEELSQIVVDCGYRLHVELGPGLLESVYEVVLAKMLQDRGLSVQRQLPVPIQAMGLQFDEGFRVDLMIEQKLVVELKSIEKLEAVHYKQLLTYLRLLNLPVGLLINYGAATFKEGVRRVVNRHQDFAASRLRVNRLQAGRNKSQ